MKKIIQVLIIILVILNSSPIERAMFTPTHLITVIKPKETNNPLGYGIPNIGIIRR